MESNIMDSLIDDILFLRDKLEHESMFHLKQKADLSKELKELSIKENNLSRDLCSLKEKLESGKFNKIDKTSIEIEELIKTKNQLKKETHQIENQLTPFEEKITQLKTQSSIIDSKITTLTQEKNRILQSIKRTKFVETSTRRSNIKIINEKQKIKKTKKQLEKQEEIYNNLKAFSRTLNQIEEVLSGFSYIENAGKQYSSQIPADIQEQIIEAKKRFDSAKTKFKSNNIVPFLIDADKSYRSIVSAFIKLNSNLPNYSSLIEEKFSTQVFTLVSHGLKLNTRHLNAVKNMLTKLEKGVEISPLASFANEIRDYFAENLSIFRLTGVTLFLD